MRLWSLNPTYLDRRALVACWREGLLAQKVLLGQTRGYTHHPQLQRFRDCEDPLVVIGWYLGAIQDEAVRRSYSFDRSKISASAPRAACTARAKEEVKGQLTPASGSVPRAEPVLSVTTGQLAYELEHLRKKVQQRAPEELYRLPDLKSSTGLELGSRGLNIRPHPLFTAEEGDIEPWEVISGK